MRYMTFVAGDGIRSKDDDVARLDLDIAMRPGRHPIEHGTKLTLRAGTDDTHLTIRQFNDILHSDDSVLRDIQPTGL